MKRDEIMKIITLTLNPAFDIHCNIDDFKPYCENLASIGAYDTGGKGVNISRALSANGVENIAYIVVGDENGAAFSKRLDVDGVVYKQFMVLGRIRENITIHTKDKPETRISFAGFAANNEVIQRIKTEIEKENLSDAVVTLTGRLPDGVSTDSVVQLLLCLKEKGDRIVIDSRSFGRSDIMAVKPWLIKPNEEEIGLYTDIAVKDIKSAGKAASMLRAEGIENVMISLGGKGAVLCCEDGLFGAIPPKIDVISTIGAGDSTIAGFIDGVSRKLLYVDAFKMGIAYGTAACLTDGTIPPKSEVIEEIYKSVVVKDIYI